jgi:hypothetical protein
MTHFRSLPCLRRGCASMVLIPPEKTGYPAEGERSKKQDKRGLFEPSNYGHGKCHKPPWRPQPPISCIDAFQTAASTRGCPSHGRHPESCAQPEMRVLSKSRPLKLQDRTHPRVRIFFRDRPRRCLVIAFVAASSGSQIPGCYDGNLSTLFFAQRRIFYLFDALPDLAIHQRSQKLLPASF